MYQSVALLEKYAGWCGLLISGGVTLRCGITLLSAYFEGDFQSAFTKSKKILFAGIVGVCINSFILFAKRFYF